MCSFILGPVSLRLGSRAIGTHFAAVCVFEGQTRCLAAQPMTLFAFFLFSFLAGLTRFYLLFLPCFGISCVVIFVAEDAFRLPGRRIPMTTGQKGKG